MSIAKIFLGLCAAFQTYAMILEMFFWTKPLGLKTFRLTPQMAEQSKTLAMNQGLYNGFLAAGFVWAILHEDPVAYFQIGLFFSICMIAAAVLGACTANWRILLFQGLPPAIAALALYFYW